MLLTSTTGADIVLAGLTIPHGEDSVHLGPEEYLADENRRAEINRLYDAGSINVDEEHDDSLPSGQRYDFEHFPGSNFPARTAGELEASGESASEQFTIKFNVPGVLTVAAGQEHIPMPHPGKLLKVQAALGTYVAGADLVLDVNKAGTTIFTTQTDRLHITDGGAEAEHDGPWTVADVATKQFAEGDLVSVDVDAIGTTSGHHGSDLDVELTFEKIAGAIHTDD